MKINKLAVVLAIPILFMFDVSADAIVTSQVSIVAGGSVDVEYTLIYNGGGSTVCHVSTNIFPDGDGFNLSYPPVFVLYGGTNIFTVHIDTSFLLMPRNYSLNVTFDLEQVESPPVITNTIIITKTEFVNQSFPVYLNQTNASITIPSSIPVPYVPPPPIIIFANEKNMQSVAIFLLSALSVILMVALVSVFYFYRKKPKIKTL